MSSVVKKQHSIKIDRTTELLNNPDRKVLSPLVIYVEHIVKDKDGNQLDFMNTLNNFTDEKITEASNIMFARITYNVSGGGEGGEELSPNVEINTDFMAPGVIYKIPTMIPGQIYKLILRADTSTLDCYLQTA